MKRLIKFDWAIKKLLRDKSNFEILEGFISELLREEIKIIEVLESETNKEHEEDKFNRVDLLVKDSKNRLVLVEVQNEYELDYFQRILYGSSKLITGYIKEGELYRNIKKVISISIVYFDLGQGEDYIYYGSTTFKGMHKNDELQLTERQKKLFVSEEISSLFPEYYLIETKRFNDKLQDKLDEWVYFLKNDEIRDDFNAKGIQMASKKLDIMKMDISKQKEYERYLENLRYKASIVDSSYGEGIARGETIGFQKGEKQRTNKVAINMLEMGIGLDIISKATGLGEKEIMNLKDDIG